MVFGGFVRKFKKQQRHKNQINGNIFIHYSFKFFNESEMSRVTFQFPSAFLQVTLSLKNSLTH